MKRPGSAKLRAVFIFGKTFRKYAGLRIEVRGPGFGGVSPSTPYQFV